MANFKQKLAQNGVAWAAALVQIVSGVALALTWIIGIGFTPYMAFAMFFALALVVTGLKTVFTKRPLVSLITGVVINVVGLIINFVHIPYVILGFAIWNLVLVILALVLYVGAIVYRFVFGNKLKAKETEAAPAQETPAQENNEQ